MNTRIRYMPSADGGMVSRRVIETGAGEMTVKFYAETLSALIINAASNKVIDTCNATSLHKLKILIKDKLIKLGANFEDETRKERTLK